jgi:hypothetical protein
MEEAKDVVESLADIQRSVADSSNKNESAGKPSIC